MEKAGIYHQPASSYAYSYDAKTLHIRIRTKRLDISEVTLIAADPYLWKDGKWQSESYTMRKIAETESTIIGFLQLHQNIDVFNMAFY